MKCQFELRTEVLTCEYQLRTEVSKWEFELRAEEFGNVNLSLGQKSLET